MTERTVDRRRSSPQHRAEFDAAQAAPTEHQPRLVTTPQIRHLIHGAGTIGQFNSRLAVLASNDLAPRNPRCRSQIDIHARSALVSRK